MKKLVHVVGAAIVRRDTVLVARRGPGMSHPGVWEFPGGKLEPGETPQQALARELDEELGVAVSVGAFVASCEQPLPGGRMLKLDVYLARLSAPQEPEAREHDALVWARREELEGFAWAPADVPAMRALAEQGWSFR